MRRTTVVGIIFTLGLSAAAPLAVADTTTTTGTNSTTAPTTTTTVKRVPLAPLTGLADPTGISRRRPALTVKIDNTFDAHPQFGLDVADVIYEEIVEGGITRLAAVFNSHAPVMVGPVRSVRRTDREIVYDLGGIFVFSGGAQYAVSSIMTAPVKLFQQSNGGAAMYRLSTRSPPHNLIANVARLITQGGRPKPPPALFTFRSKTTVAKGSRVKSFVVGFANGYATTWTWNARNGSWDRSLFGYPDYAADHVRLSPANVIVMKVHYRGGVGVEGAEAVLTGSGPVQVFTAGRVQPGTWSRSTLRRPIVYRTSSGKVITLTPGRSWVELLDVSEHVMVAYR